jgi:SNF2 family DNA or RNA helicase
MTYSFKTKPYTHQLDCFEQSRDLKAYALLLDMGTGKTKISMDTAGWLFEKGEINFVLVVTPKGVTENWNPEITKHLPERILREVCVWKPSLTKTKRAELHSLYAPSEDALKFLLMNVEAFSTFKGVSVAESFLKKFRVLMIVDESTTIKNRQSKRSKALCRLGELASFKRILTGSPVTRSPLDLYPQMYFLDPDILGFSSFYSFQARYAVVRRRSLGSHSFNEVMGYQRLDELTDKLAKNSFRIRKIDCLDLPDKVYIRREVELTPDQKQAYKQMSQLALALLKEGKLSSTKNVLTQIMRLQQICLGHITDDEGMVHELKSNRMKELLEVIEELQGKVIIWATWTRDIRSIASALQDRYGIGTVARLHGETPDNERQGIVESFQDTSSKLRFLVGHPRTGGHGLTLTAGSFCIYYSNSYDLELRIQSEDRAHRIGQLNKVTYIDLISSGTVDEKIVKALRAKINIADTILGEQMRKWLI